MLNAIAYLLIALGMLEKQHAEGIKTDWRRALAVIAWIVVFVLAAIGVLIWGLERKEELVGLAGFLVVIAAGYAALAIGVRRWPATRK